MQITTSFRLLIPNHGSVAASCNANFNRFKCAGGFYAWEQFDTMFRREKIAKTVE